MKIHNVDVKGVGVDDQTRCAHYPGETDIIAIKFACCEKWFPCYECHAELAGHVSRVWPNEQFDTPAILCGACGHELTVREYLDCKSTCPRCRQGFNPRCASHRHLYFETPVPTALNVGGASVPRSSGKANAQDIISPPIGALRPLPHLRQIPRPSAPHSKNLRLHRWSDVSATFFVTKSLLPKKPVLDAEARAVIVSAFRFAVQYERIHLRAFVVMPDHWHALVALREPWTLPKFTHAMMSFVGRKTDRVLSTHGTAWQDGYYDTHLKTARQFEYVARYIEQNPVVKGFVDLPEQWDASSAGCKEAVTDPWPLMYD